MRTSRGAVGQTIAALALLLVIGATAVPARADQGVLSYFIGVRAIGAYSQIGDVETTGFGGSSLIKHDTDEVAGVGPVAGVRFNNIPLRVELEVAYRFRFDFDLRDTAPGNVVDHEIDVSTTSALMNAILEWRNTTSFTPFAGAAIGWARNTADVSRVVNATRAKSTRSQDTDNFAWGGLAGVDWDFAQNWTAQFAYRYTDLGKVESGVSSAGETITGGSYTSHDLLLGLFYRF